MLKDGNLVSVTLLVSLFNISIRNPQFSNTLNPNLTYGTSIWGRSKFIEYLMNYSPEPESYFPNCVCWGKGKHSQQKNIYQLF
jgi:hypothetical protein